MITSREAEIENINKEREKIESDLKKIEENMKCLETELTKLSVQKTMKKQKCLNCPICSQLFESHSRLEKHISNKNVEENIRCNKCEMSFRSEWRLKKHNRTHEENVRQRRCHYFNSNKQCPFQQLGCKFLHEVSEACHYGTRCQRHMCQFRH